MNPALLARLIERAHQDRDAAQRDLNQCLTRQNAAQETLQTLIRFRSDAHDHGPVRQPRSVPVALLEQAMQFDQRMTQAIETQTSEYQRLEQASALQRNQLLAAQQRAHALQALARRIALQAQAKQAKLEQKLTDEFATQRAARHRARP